MWYRRTFTVPRRLERRLRPAAAAELRRRRLRRQGLGQRHSRSPPTAAATTASASTSPTRSRGSGPQELIVWAEDLTDATWQPIGKQRRVSDRGIFYQGSSGIWQTVWMEPVAARRASNTLEADARTSAPARSRSRPPTTPARRAHASRRSPTTANRQVGKVDRSGRHAADRAGAEREAVVAGPPVPLRPAGPAAGRAAHASTRCGRTSACARSARRGRRRQAADRPQRQDPLPHVHPRPGLLAGRPEHRADRRGARVSTWHEHKELGFNTVRKHIKVEPDRWYYWADRLGPDGLAGHARRCATATRARPAVAASSSSRSCARWSTSTAAAPSIVMWVPFNEGWGEWDRERDRPDRRRRQGPGPDPAGQRAQRRTTAATRSATPARAT